MHRLFRAGLRLPHWIVQGAGARLLGSVTQVVTAHPIVALTFDDGPNPDATPQLLKILQGHHARATFFMVGAAANKYPELVKAVALAGHAIGNHSWDHPSFRLIGGRTRRRQMRACSAALAPYGQRLFRPPYGHQSLASRIDALVLGYEVVTWDVLGIDWLNNDADTLVRSVVNRIKPGSIVLFHDALFGRPANYAGIDRTPTLHAVAILLETLSNRFTFVTVPELFRLGSKHRQPWYWKPHPEMLARLEQHPAVGVDPRYRPV